MSTVNIMLLGILLKKPLNAYEMKKKMESMNIRRWTKISTPAIYKNLVNLHRRGYLDAEVVRDGEMPEKTVYTVNENGRKYFVSLMEHLAQNPGTVYIDFATLIAHLNKLNHADSIRVLEELLDNLNNSQYYLAESLKEKESLPEANAIIGLYRDMYQLFCNWTENYLKKMKEEDS
ncbi:PadR family transcriptional regulator [Caproicibacter sp.]|uniref:PadR family transcriptional regulator n=1 Tax=Caproicibacter sp. TaxID=2814884 RepID=UPI003989BB81